MTHPLPPSLPPSLADRLPPLPSRGGLRLRLPQRLAASAAATYSLAAQVAAASMF